MAVWQDLIEKFGNDSDKESRIANLEDVVNTPYTKAYRGGLRGCDGNISHSWVIQVTSNVSLTGASGTSLSSADAPFFSLECTFHQLMRYCLYWV